MLAMLRVVVLVTVLTAATAQYRVAVPETGTPRDLQQVLKVTTAEHPPDSGAPSSAPEPVYTAQQTYQAGTPAAGFPAHGGYQYAEYTTTLTDQTASAAPGHHADPAVQTYFTYPSQTETASPSSSAGGGGPEAQTYYAYQSSVKTAYPEQSQAHAAYFGQSQVAGYPQLSPSQGHSATGQAQVSNPVGPPTQASRYVGTSQAPALPQLPPGFILKPPSVPQVSLSQQAPVLSTTSQLPAASIPEVPQQQQQRKITVLKFRGTEQDRAAAAAARVEFQGAFEGYDRARWMQVPSAPQPVRGQTQPFLVSSVRGGQPSAAVANGVGGAGGGQFATVGAVPATAGGGAAAVPAWAAGAAAGATASPPAGHIPAAAPLDSTGGSTAGVSSSVYSPPAGHLTHTGPTNPTDAQSPDQAVSGPPSRFLVVGQWLLQQVLAQLPPATAEAMKKVSDSVPLTTWEAAEQLVEASSTATFDAANAKVIQWAVTELTSPSDVPGPLISALMKLVEQWTHATSNPSQGSASGLGSSQTSQTTVATSRNALPNPCVVACEAVMNSEAVSSHTYTAQAVLLASAEQALKAANGAFAKVEVDPATEPTTSMNQQIKDTTVMTHQATEASPSEAHPIVQQQAHWPPPFPDSSKASSSPPPELPKSSVAAENVAAQSVIGTSGHSTAPVRQIYSVAFNIPERSLQQPVLPPSSAYSFAETPTVAVSSSRSSVTPTSWPVYFPVEGTVVGSTGAVDSGAFGQSSSTSAGREIVLADQLQVTSTVNTASSGPEYHTAQGAVAPMAHYQTISVSGQSSIPDSSNLAAFSGYVKQEPVSSGSSSGAEPASGHSSTSAHQYYVHPSYSFSTSPYSQGAEHFQYESQPSAQAASAGPGALPTGAVSQHATASVGQPVQQLRAFSVLDVAAPANPSTASSSRAAATVAGSGGHTQLKPKFYA